MGVVGTVLAVLFLFLLWRFCIRRKGRNVKGRNSGNINQITPQYHPVPTIPGDRAHVSLIDNSMSTRSDEAISRYGRGIQKYGSIILLLSTCSHSFFDSNNLYGSGPPPVTLAYDRGSSSYSGVPSTIYTNQSGSSLLPRSQQVHHDPQDLQRRISTLSTMTDRPPVYSPSPILDESVPGSSLSSNGNTDEKMGRSRVLAYTPGTDLGVELTSTAIPGRREENDSAWDGGYPQPLRFVPIA